jgi:hypothetical protein
MVRRPGHHAVHGQLEVGRREHRRRASTIMCCAARSTRSTRCATCSASRACTRSAIASPARRSPRRSLISRPRARRTRSSRRPSSPRRSISAKPATSSCSSATRRWGCWGKLTAEKGYLDGRYMAATFNLLRGRDLIWNYVVNNYLLGRSRRRSTCSTGTATPPTCRRLAPRLSRDALQGEQAREPGAVSVIAGADRPRTSKTPTYIQAGREDHIAPPQSVWKIMNHFAGPSASCSPGRGISPGVVNPPAAGKYQYWINDSRTPPRRALDEFVAGATEHKGSWWPDWIEWLKAQAPKRSRPMARACLARASSSDRGRAGALRRARCGRAPPPRRSASRARHRAEGRRGRSAARTGPSLRPWAGHRQVPVRARN